MNGRMFDKRYRREVELKIEDVSISRSSPSNEFVDTGLRLAVQTGDPSTGLCNWELG